MCSWTFRNSSGDCPQTPRRYVAERGRNHPLGAHQDAGGINFAFFSEHATGVELLLFDRHDAAEPFQTIVLDHELNRSFAIWHAYLRGLSAPVFYALRVFGPQDEASRHLGHRFDPQKALIDPYSRGLDRSLWQRGSACGPGDNVATSLRSAVVDLAGYDWEGDEPLCRPMEDLVIYELHVGGFTRSPSVGRRGSRHLRRGDREDPATCRSSASPRSNCCRCSTSTTARSGTSTGTSWPTTGVTAPRRSSPRTPVTASRPSRASTSASSATWSRRCTGPASRSFSTWSSTTPTKATTSARLYSFAGLDNENYYYLDPADRQFYYDYSGCGNTLNGNHPIVSKMIVDCLEYWVREMHVDGFRFDVAVGADPQPRRRRRSTSRRWSGRSSCRDVLAETKIIAEAWDAAGAYQVGTLPGLPLGGVERPLPRQHPPFVRGEPGHDRRRRRAAWPAAPTCTRRAGDRPTNSVNFVTCHDGFTLNDLVSLRQQAQPGQRRGQPRRQRRQHELELRRRRPDRRPGGAGPADPADQELRHPADAVARESRCWWPATRSGRTQQGNNNAYCQDNEINWFDWDLAGERPELFRFWAQLMRFRRAHRGAARAEFYTGLLNNRGLPDLTWHGTSLVRTRLGRPAGAGAGLHDRRAGRRPGPARDDEHVLGAAAVRGHGRARPPLGPGDRHRPAVTGGPRRTG